ncbi:MAG: hypothetical protein Q8L26_06610 [Candidatus Omnitrophota bacterium]|nr:hypothetical protein [Candidatus Omnitrophota bacterium]
MAKDKNPIISESAFKNYFCGVRTRTKKYPHLIEVRKNNGIYESAQ